MGRMTSFGGLLVAAFSLACSDSRQIVDPLVAGSETAQIRPRLVATSFSSTVLIPGDTVPWPEVRAIDSKTLKPLAGIKVTFAASGGEIERTSVTTDANGLAQAGRWTPDFTKSPTITASAENGTNAVHFAVSMLNKKLVGQYQLQSIAGQSLPIGFSGGGSTWYITGGGYRLFDDGTYVFGYEEDHVQSWSPPMTYVVNGNKIEFYLSAASAPQSSFYAERGYHFATGTINGNTMSVKYEDFIDFEDEVYVSK